MSLARLDVFMGAANPQSYHFPACLLLFSDETVNDPSTTWTSATYTLQAAQGRFGSLAAEESGAWPVGQSRST
jgi:hypothetical protein